MLHEEDRNRLRHMRDAAREAQRFIRDCQPDDLEHDTMLSFALVRAIEIIGEAACRMTLEGRNELPELPWPAIISMRNRLIHAYFEIDYERVWHTVTDDLPPLVEIIERSLARP